MSTRENIRLIARAPYVRVREGVNAILKKRGHVPTK